MKRFITILMTIAMIAALATGVSAVSSSDAKITAIKATPVIDGKIDDVWLTAEQQDVALVDTGTIPSKSTTTGKMRVMWDDSYFYVLVEVDKHGIPLYTGGGSENTDDCTEIGITINGNFTGESNVPSGDQYAGAFRVYEDGKFGGFGDLFTNNTDKFKGSFTRVGDDKYLVEYAVPWLDIKPAEGSLVSLEIQLNDNSKGSGRDGLVTWANNPCIGWRDSLVHGKVTLGAALPAETAAPVTEAAATTTVTTTTAPATYDYGMLAVFTIALALVITVTLSAKVKAKAKR